MSSDFPEMRVTFDSNGKKQDNIYRNDYWLIIQARNSGKILTNYVNAYLNIKNEFLDEDGRDDSEEIQIFMDNTIRDVVDFQFGYTNPIPKYGPSRYDPILPMRTMKLKSVKINKNFLNSEEVLEWIVFADNSEPRKGKINISQIELINI